MMFRYSKLATVFALFVLAVSISASARSINDSFSGTKLTGVSQGGTVSGTFSFNTATDQFSNIAVSFVSNAFGNVNATDQGSIMGKLVNGLWSFQWSTIKNGDLIIYQVVFNPNTNQFTASGSIANFWNQGKFSSMSMPEGETPLSYLMLSGFAMFAGIAVASKRRRAARIAQYS
jgi:hypothetical protein